MVLEVRKYDFGSLLENDIMQAIELTGLCHYALHNLVLKTADSWLQIDHLIVLPHKIVIIEAKNSTCHTYRVYDTKDIVKYTANGEPKDYGKSVVRQTTRSLVFLRGILSDFTLDISAVGCIRANKVVSHQTKLPIFTDESIWFYLKSLESEMGSFTKHFITKTFNKVADTLEPFIRTWEEYEEYLNGNGKYNSTTMIIEDGVRGLKSLTLEESNPIKEVKVFRNNRIDLLRDLLLADLKVLPTGYEQHCIDNPMVKVESIATHYVYMNVLTEKYPWFPRLWEGVSMYVNKQYLVDYCQDNMIFYSEFMYACLDYIKERASEEFSRLQAGEVETSARIVPELVLRAYFN